MRARNRSVSKANRGAMRVLDNVIFIAVYVVVTGYILAKLYQFVANAVTR
jgi:hypothetical protein